MEMTIQKVLADSGVAFGTSGARGLVTQLTDEACAAFTAAFLGVMRQHGRVERLAIGRDLRPSSPAMAAACTAAATALGVEVDDYGVLPTPALALQAMADGVPAIMITGSHIPFDRNGIKFYHPEGEITKADEAAIMAAQGELPTLAVSDPQPASARAWEGYVARYAEWFVGQPLAGWRVGLYQHLAAGRDLNHQVLEALGAEVVVLGRSDSFVPVDTEAVGQQDRERGRAWAEQHGLEALLSTDGDGDRPLLGDEQGRWLRGDIVGLLCARELGIRALAVPVSCNTAIDACGAFEAVRRTRIGSPYVLDAMLELSRQHLRVAGFEANGGFLLGSDLQEGERRLSALPTRDALLPALTLMVAAARRGVALSALAAELPARYTASDRLQQVPTERSRELLASWTTDTQAMRQALDLKAPIDSHDTTDGLRVTLQDGEIVHLRPSGNAPELRCYVEAASEDRAQALVAQVIGRLVAIMQEPAGTA
ncbi:phosphomannomutase [Halomonas cerina]|uniref:Phosphomannomutase n=1 Tax=Halomonas cerina TaxID=447424 RepID=A0A839V7F1_9GAMM|nr:phosphomannomutase [Halomonas cerina]MBB3189449.1 phosphomannomutase [Halomonas cerina]